MEDDAIENSSGSSLLPVAMAILALVLGAAGLYFGLTANQRLVPLSDTLEAGTSSAARLEKALATLETQLTELSAKQVQVEEALGRLRSYSNISERSVKEIASSVKGNRAEIVKLVQRVNELVTARVPEAPATATASSSPRESRPEIAGASSAGADPSPGSTGTYTIASGDTFAKIAAKLGVGLQALLDANPDADPRRLAIGQVINVPAN